MRFVPSCLFLVVSLLGGTLGLTSCKAPTHRLQELPDEAAVRAKVSWDAFDNELLSAAIFAETNRVRREFGLRALRARSLLRGAAEVQAFTNAITGIATHDNPLAGRARVWDRVKHQGLEASIVLENVLVTFVREPESGGPVRVETDANGRRTRRDDETGSRLPWPTYAELAARIVGNWMNSPAHRLNLLNKDVRYLACGVEMARSPTGGEIVHAIQVFMAPL